MSERFSASGVTHAYGPVVVLRDVSFELRSGHVAGLVGENGSGKSTLLKIMTGALTPSLGELRLDDELVSFSSPADAYDAGIAVVHQDYNLFDDLSVAENVLGVTGRVPRRRFTRGVDRDALADEVAELLAELGIEIHPGSTVRSLDAAERKFVEIARAMVSRPRFLILDEPTAALEPEASARVLELVTRLRENGVGSAVVSHRLDEIKQVSDEVTILRDGELLDVVAAADVTERRLAEAIGGPNATRTVAREEVHEINRDLPPAIELRNVQLRAGRAGVSIDVAPGEIVGVTGLLGAGSARLVAGVGGAEPFESEILVNGKPVRVSSPSAARRAGIGFIHEDRKAAGIVPDQSVANNIALASLENVLRGPWIDRSAIDRQAEKFREDLNIRLSSIHAPVKSLSGGNQQKVLLARWLASGVNVLAIDEPTHGVDVGGKSQIHALLREFAEAGGAVLVASTDVGEVLDLCDRVAVLRHGELAAFKDIHGLTRADLTVLGTQEAA